MAGIGKFDIRVLRYYAAACYFTDCDGDSISWGINGFGFSPVARLWWHILLSLEGCDIP